MQPHDRAEGERGDDGARERPRLVASTREDDAAHEERSAHDESSEFAHRVREPDRMRHPDEGVAPMRLDIREAIEKVWISGEPVKADHRPRAERHDRSDRDRPRGRAESARRKRPHEQRPHEELRRHCEPQRPGRWPDSVPVAPRDRGGERDRDRDVPEENSADRRHPQKRRRVAADVADSEQSKGQAEEREKHPGHDHRDDSLGERRERDERQEKLRRVHVPLLVLEDRVVEARIGRAAVQHVVGGREVREPHVPGKQALRRAERDDGRA